MPEKLITTDPPRPQIEDFEEFLATDDLFINYFNSFLELPSFPEPLRFNSETGGFEVLSPDKNKIADKIKALSRAQTPRSAVYKNAIAKPPIRLPHYENDDADLADDDVKTSFSVKCLDKEQGIQWIKENRLPTFLRSDLYMEYRLAKLLSQIETSRGGIKLTIDKSYRPWYKPKPIVRSPSPVDETIEMIQRLNVTIGAMSTSQTKEWFSVAKQVENVSVTTGNGSRPVSSVSMGTSAPWKRASSSRPMSVGSSRIGVADNADDYLGGGACHEENSKAKSRFTSASSVVFSPASSSVYPFRDEEAARIVPLPVKSLTQVGHVVKIEPEASDDESDQGVGSDSDDAMEATNEEAIKEEPAKSYSFEVNDIDSYASVLVSLVIKNAFQHLTPNLDTNQIDHVTNLDSIVPVLSRGTPLSKLDSTVFSEAILEHESKILEENESLCRRTAREIKSASTKISDDVTMRTESPLKKSITFKEKDISRLDDEADSVFSDETDESESSTSGKKFDLTDSKGFSKFRAFLNRTVGGKLVSLWMDIDKSRFIITNKKTQHYLQRMRETYLKVGSTKRLPNELLEKYKLLHATQWTIPHLHKVQREIVEPLLLYWAPRFLVRQMSLSPRDDQSKSKVSRPRDLRPLSSQSHPCPKTITILPLRPKSCLPRIKHGQHPTVGRGHVVSDYHCYVKPDVYMTQHDPPPKLTTPSPIPSYLKPKVAAMTEENVKQRMFPSRRPATAGPLTRQTRARFERRKSVAAKSREHVRSRTNVIIPSPATSVTSDSTIRGTTAMESMLQALYHDTRAGWFFTQFCENSKNLLWSNSIHFWFDVQEYHYLFYRDIIDQFTIERKSQTIYSTYIVGGSPEDIGISIATRKQIRIMIHPPFDELFDVAEEYVLKVLIVPWNKMMGMDRESYSKVELVEQERRLAVASKYMGCLQKKGILKEKKAPVATEQESIEKYEEDLWEKVSEEFKSYSFDDLVRNRIELEYFRKFLDENYVKTDLLCWLDIESFKRLPHQADEKRDEKAKMIKEKYLHKKYFFGPNSPASKQEQSLAVKAGGGWGKILKERPPTELIVEAQKYVKKRIEKRWLPLFLATTAFQERQRPKSQMSEVAEDVVLQKKKKRGEPWKLLDNKWQSSSRDLMEFRRALSNPVTAGQFRRYVSLKGEFLENDVLFWLEVQKYKDFCHIHNDAASIEGKVMSIINCFINSHIPPTLQIDISSDMGEKLIERRKELGPYVFRESQLTVFRVLFPHWGGFCDFRKTLSDEKITTTLERKRKKKIERMKQQMKEQEKEEARREELRTSKEVDTFDLPDVISLKGSEIADTLLSGRPANQMSWSYGKYVEGLDRQRALLLMENEVKGRVPLEALPDPDYDVSTEDSEASSDSDDAKSLRTDDASITSQGRKRRKEKVIHSTVRPPAISDVNSVKNDVTNGSSKENKKEKFSKISKKGNDVKPAAVTVD